MSAAIAAVLPEAEDTVFAYEDAQFAASKVLDLQVVGLHSSESGIRLESAKLLGEVRRQCTSLTSRG